jgi:GrpB-like predicted nucleotidyltransferase (UPF0157 family)
MPGLMRKVVMVPYRPDWPERFEQESARLRPVFGEKAQIHHIGSTSVPGLCAKPVIDILVEVPNIRQVDRLNPQMELLGYEPRGEFGLPGRRYFPREVDGERTHHVHVYKAGTSEARRHLAFRDYLRSHPQTAEEYGRLKSQLALSYPEDIQGYMDGKDAFVKDVERQALDWDLARRIEIHPLTAEQWDDFEKLFGPHGAYGGCWCMFWLVKHKEFDQLHGEKARLALKGRVDSGIVPGLLAYLDGQPAGWAAYGPRDRYLGLQNSRILAPVDNQPVWSIPCFYIARGQRRRGLTTALVRAVIDEVRKQGGKILEAYPVEPKKDQAVDAYVFTGLASTFRKLGFSEVVRRSETRPIFRLEL